ncbi:kpsM protein [Ideonella dechloratans]|uniref:KpsM protein n=1 Tax=Ideonella dechloratans TaxID=36863 RepID=A0A643FBK3_IDEDE|nr:ABC transporter permease [Ideonella dechloratans]KAB0582479.1 kpsM protein [Ideonella dechloratans]UFU10521.1 ABC transporter permease [Ideonella dechloratans]
MKKRTPWQIQRAVIFALLMRELKTRFGTHWTGVVWLLGTPLAQVGVLVGFNTFLRGRLHEGLYPYAVFLMVALMPFRLCTGLWSQLMNAAKANQGLFNYRQVVPMDAFISRAILELVLNVLIFVLSMLILARLGVPYVFPEHLLYLFAVWAVYFFFGAGMGLLLAGLSGPMPRIGTLVNLISMPLYMLSGVIFVFHAPTPDIKALLLFNPLMHLVECGREAYLAGYRVDQGINMAYPSLWALTLCFLGMGLCRIRRQELAAGE